VSDAASPKAELEPPLSGRWRAEAERAQSAALPRGRVAVSCPAPFGVGGLGRHLQEIAAAVERGGGEAMCVCEPGGGHGPSAPWREVHLDMAARARVALARFSPAWRARAVSACFDSAAARQLPEADHLISFNGTSVAQFARARTAARTSLCLMSANSHMRHVLRQHAIAYRQYPLEQPWATRLLARNVQEYAAADRIYLSSRYSRQSFIDEGFAEEALAFFPLAPDPRFTPAAAAPSSGSFDVVYVGALTVHKGVPLLVDAIRRLPFNDLRLVLVGGWKTRGMRRFLQAAAAEDARINLCVGDPLPRLRAARLYVHPAYEDGFAYAAAEALACGVPVLVSEDTGMKELIRSERDGLVLPTGGLDALTEAIAASYRGEVFGA
jgi:glycosyltransferase involved in cell wall biosynthesis